MSYHLADSPDRSFPATNTWASTILFGVVSVLATAMMCWATSLAATP